MVGLSMAAGNFVERYFYKWLWPGADFGPSRLPQPTPTPATLAAMNKTLQSCGFYTDSWPPAAAA